MGVINTDGTKFPKGEMQKVHRGVGDSRPVVVGKSGRGKLLAALKNWQM